MKVADIARHRRHRTSSEKPISELVVADWLCRPAMQAGSGVPRWRPMLFTPQTTGTLHLAKLGRWDLGERLKDEKLREKHLNLYVVFPGGQYKSLLHSRYNHTFGKLERFAIG